MFNRNALYALLCYAGFGLGGSSVLASAEFTDLHNSDWVVTATVDERDCGGQIYTTIQYYSITQSGNQLMVTDADGYSYTGTISGQDVSWQGSYADDPGITTLTLNAKVSDDWLTMQGTSSFVYHVASLGFSCSGSGDFTGVRTVDEVEEPEEPVELNFADLNQDWPIYLGGTSRDLAAAVEVDYAGNIIVAGISSSDTFAWLDGDDLREQEGFFGSQFVLKFDEQGRYIWGKVLNNSAFVAGMTVDFQNNILVMGSHDLIKLSPEGEVLWTHSFQDWGYQVILRDGTNSYVSSGRRLAVNQLNQIIVGGRTTVAGLASGGFDTEFNGINPGATDGYIQVLSPQGERLWSTYLGGTRNDSVQGVAVSPVSGTIYVTGNTTSTNWVSGGMSTLARGQTSEEQTVQAQTCFVAALSASGDHIWSTFLGASLLEEEQDDNSFTHQFDECYAINLDLNNSLNIIGNTNSKVVSLGEDGVNWLPPAGWMPSAGEPHASMLRLEPTQGYFHDAFAVKMFNNGSDLVWGTYLGKQGSNIIPLSLDSTAQGDVYIVGKTTSGQWAVRGRDTVYNGESDGFWIYLTSAGHTRSSSYLGGVLNDEAWSVVLDRAENPIIVGITESPYWAVGDPLLRLNPDPNYQGDFDAFIVRLLPGVRPGRGVPVWLPAILP